MSDSHSNRSFPSMSSSSEETGSAGSSIGFTSKSEKNNNGTSNGKISATSPRSSSTTTKPTSNRSSLSSLASMSSSSFSGGGPPSSTGSLQPQSLNQALAMVNNKWDREQRKQDQEATRKLTLLKQRKISAVLKVENLQKSLKSSSSEPSSAIQKQLQQVKELEEEVAVVDRELGLLGAERELNSRKINLKRAQHVTTLQQLGLLEALALSDSEAPPASLSASSGSSSTSSRWRSEVDLKDDARRQLQRQEVYQPLSMTDEDHHLFAAAGSRKISPPFAAILSESSRIRSGSDPALAMNGGSEPSRTEPIVRFFRSQDENRKPSTESMTSNTGSRSGRWGGSHRTPESSPKSSRRNPLRMLSNAMDFRYRKRGSHRPKSADFERVSENPAGDAAGASSSSTTSSTSVLVGRGSVDRAKYDPNAGSQGPRLLTPPSSFSYSLSNSRYSLPNLDPNDMEEALNIVRTSPFLTNPRNPKIGSAGNGGSSRHPPPLYPLENRNSAPEIVVTNSGSPQSGTFYQQAPTATSTMPSSRRLHHGGLEERIQRAKAKVQNGLMLHMGSGSSIGSSSSSSSLSAFSPSTTGALSPGNAPPPPSGPSSMSLLNGLPPSNHSNGGRVKLSTRFQTAQKLNYKLAALSNFSTSIHVKRSRTFNVSDVQDQLAAMGNNNNINNNNNVNSKTLPKQLRNSKLKSSSRDSTEFISMSSGFYRQSSPSSISVGTISGTSSTASSRKSSNSSSNGGGCDQSIRTRINQEALDEIAAFEDFMNRFLLNHSGDECSNGSDSNMRSSPHNNSSNLITSAKKKKNALRRIAAVNSEEPKVTTLQRQRQLSSQESDEVTPT